MSEKTTPSVGDCTTTELKHKLGQVGEKCSFGLGKHRAPWLSIAARNRYTPAEENARRAAAKLNHAGYETLVAPALPYGVTDFAAGFAGAISILDALVDFGRGRMRVSG